MKRIIAVVTLALCLFGLGGTAMANGLETPEDFANIIGNLRLSPVSDDICSAYVRSMSADLLRREVLEHLDMQVSIGEGKPGVPLGVFLKTDAAEIQRLYAKAKNHYLAKLSYVVKQGIDSDYFYASYPVHCVYMVYKTGVGGHGEGIYLADEYYVLREIHNEIDSFKGEFPQQGVISINDLYQGIREYAKAKGKERYKAWLEADPGLNSDYMVLRTLLLEYKLTPDEIGLPPEAAGRILNGEESGKAKPQN